MNNFCIILLFFVFNSCKARDILLTGKWRVASLKNIIHMDKKDVDDLRKDCIGKIVEIEKIGKNDIVYKGATNCDVKAEGCDTMKLSSISLKVVDGDAEYKKYPGQEIYKGEISKTFLNFIDYTNPEKFIQVYETNCSISWGEEPLKIIPVTKEIIVFLLGSYILTLEKA